MQAATTLTLSIAALFFSLMCAILFEELIFGGLFRLFLAPRSERPQQHLDAGRKA
jgi:hypothetical protein